MMKDPLRERVGTSERGSHEATAKAQDRARYRIQKKGVVSSGAFFPTEAKCPNMLRRSL
jgi:hypothetical protein